MNRALELARTAGLREFSRALCVDDRLLGHLAGKRRRRMTPPSAAQAIERITSQEKDEVFDRIFGFFDVKALMVAIDEHIPTILAEGPMTRSQLVERTGLPERGLHFLLVSLMSLTLVEENDGQLTLTPTARKF